MPTETDILATAQAIIDTHARRLTPPTPPPLLTPRRRGTGLRRLLHLVLGACSRSLRPKQPRLNPAYPRQDTAVDRVIRIDPVLYLRSLSG
jgi:hypothetical protein